MTCWLIMKVAGECGGEEQDDLRELQRGVQEGAGRHADRRAGHRPQRAHARHPQGPRHLTNQSSPYA